MSTAAEANFASARIPPHPVRARNQRREPLDGPGATSLATSPSYFHLRPALPDHDNFRAHLNPIEKINNIPVGHPDAARRHSGADRIRLVRAMDAVHA
jgi:hypothetical protein